VQEEESVEGLREKETSFSGGAGSGAVGGGVVRPARGDRQVHKRERLQEVALYRGGSWSYYAWGARAASRSGFAPGGRSGNLGFRLVRREESSVFQSPVFRKSKSRQCFSVQSSEKEKSKEHGTALRGNLFLLGDWRLVAEHWRLTTDNWWLSTDD